MRLGAFLTDPHMLKLLLGTAGAWFLFDYAYYGNTLSLPAILKEVDATASLETKLLWSLGMFVIFAVPGYLLAVKRMDRIGHRRLQFIGFSVMALCFVVLAIVPQLTQQVAPFLAILGLSYFFIQFGPNMTTFVLPSEVFPVSMRTTGHGIAAGIGKLGAFVGVFLGPGSPRPHRPARSSRGRRCLSGAGVRCHWALARTGGTNPRRCSRQPIGCTSTSTSTLCDSSPPMI